MTIGGNLTATIQVKDSGTKNSIGERIHTWTDAVNLFGWLDFSSGQNTYSTINAKLQETTHMFLCSFFAFKTLSSAYSWNPYKSSEIKKTDDDKKITITSENARMVIDGNIYDVMLIDDPMNLHEHFEIYLKYTGGGQGVS